MFPKSIGYGALAAMCLIWAAVPRSARAQADFDVNIDTSGLAGQSGSELFVELTGGGSDSGPGYNTATLGNFVLGGGSAGSVDAANEIGNVSGDIGSTVSINDQGSPLNLFAQFLTPGSDLSFQLNVTGNVNTGAVPDGLYAFLYDPSGNPIDTTSDPSGFDSLLAVNFTSATPTVSNYDTNLVSVTAASAAAAPEIDPSSAFGAVTLLAGILAVQRGRRRTAELRED